MPLIHKLSPETVKKIAAGEVVERPASIVKELVENSIDAGATSISVAVKNGGLDFISISDNGSGIAEDDLPLTIELHATSKLQDIKDLESLLTLGFRGEALASINAVSDLEIVSAQSKSQAFTLNEKGKIEPASRSQGTSVTIRNLFRQVPARRKFLKTPSTEETNIRGLIRQFAILHHNIAFTYTADSKEIWKLQAQSQKDRILSIINQIKEKDLIAIDYQQEGISIQGFVTHPKTAIRKPGQYIFVNNRTIKSPLIASAVKKGYGNKIPPELNPYFFLEVQIDSKSVDINVHPRKEEVKFSDDSWVYKHVLHAVDQSLSEFLRNEFESRFNDFNSNDNNQPVSKSAFNESFVPQKSFSTNPVASVNNYSPKTQNYSVNQALSFSENLLKDSGEVYSNFSKNSNNTNFLQIFNTYILYSKDNNLLIIDQHAADERVNYEKIKEKLVNKAVDSTPLLIPEEVILPKNIDNKLLKTLTEQLKTLGFSIGINKDSVIIDRIPSLASTKLNIPETFTELLTYIEAGDADNSSIAGLLDHVCATIACHSSIRAGQELNRQQIEKLIVDLWECHDPYTCPHGRPIVNEISRAELEKMFLRRK